MRTPLVLMASVETLVLFSSIYVASLILFGSVEDGREALGPLAPNAIIFAAITFPCLVAMGLYQFHQRLYFSEAFVRTVVGTVTGGVLLTVLLVTVPIFTFQPLVVIVACGTALVMLLVVRFCFIISVDENVFRRRTLIYGAGERAASLKDLRRRADRRGFQIVGQIAATGDQLREADGLLESNGRPLAVIARETGADEIVVAMDDRRGHLPLAELLEARLQGFQVIDLLEFLERETGKIRIDIVQPGWLIFSPGFRISRFRQFSQRSVDLLVSLGLLAIAWPAMLLITLAIKLEDGWSAPVFYRQGRIGKGGKVFDVLKYRSMQEDAEQDGMAVWARKDDDRITRVGNILRKFRLDELPQTLNVLRGDMSLVGPRPERPEFVGELKKAIPYYSERHVVKPGITGWAQVRYSYGATREDAVEKLQYDLYYIKNQTLLLDLLIILQTVEVVLWNKGAR